MHQIPETRNEFTHAEDEQFHDLVNNDNEEVEDEVFEETDKMKAQRLRVPNRKYFNDDYVTFTTQEMLTDPMTVNEVLLSEEATEWQRVMREKMESLVENNTRTECSTPAGIKYVKCKWIFKRKLNSSGHVECYKARLVTKDFLQQKGINYEETFSPIVRFSSIRCLLPLAAKYGMEVD